MGNMTENTLNIIRRHCQYNSQAENEAHLILSESFRNPNSPKMRNDNIREY